MDYMIKTKHVSGTCKCGNTFKGEIPDFAEMTMCDPCAKSFQDKRDRDRRLCAIRDSAEACGIPAKYREWNESTAKDLGNDRLLRWLSDHGHKTSVWIGGTNGIGKTHTVLYRAYQLLIDHNVYPYCVRASSWLRSTVSGRAKGDNSSERQYKRAITCQLLILDDLGKERLTEPRAELLYDLIDERDRRDAPIWITTNFTGQALMDRMNASSKDGGGHEYGFAIMKRLKRMITAERIWK